MEDREGPLFRPMQPHGSGFVRHLNRKTPWRLVKKSCQAAGIDPSRLDGRGTGINSLRKTTIDDAIRNGASMHEVREFAGNADIRTTEVNFIRKGGGRRGGGKEDPDPPDGTRRRTSPAAALPRIRAAEWAGDQ
jgi:hypothetical protein